MLQNVWAGYGGIRIHEQGLIINHPTPLPDSTGLILRNVAFRGGLLLVDINATHVSITLLSSGQMALTVRTEDNVDHSLNLKIALVVLNNQTLLLYSSSD